jgi:hypothetical protein
MFSNLINNSIDNRYSYTVIHVGPLFFAFLRAATESSSSLSNYTSRYFVAIKLGCLKPDNTNLLQLFVAEHNAPHFKTSQELIQYCVGTSPSAHMIRTLDYSSQTYIMKQRIFTRTSLLSH